MPITQCSNGKYRIGDGQCMYESHESARRAYVAYLAETGNEKADSNKVSFDYDGTISKPKWQEKAMSLKESGKTVYIVTRRQDSQSGPVYEVADKVGIPHSRVYFTNGKMKWETIKRLGIGTHYDNNPDETKLINENTDAKGVLVNEKENNMLFQYKSCDLQIKDVDAKKGIVSGYFSAFGNIDSDGDVIAPGAFKKSISEWGPTGKGRIFHLQNHNTNLKLGKLLNLEEDQFGLKYDSKVGSHTLGVDFIKMVESDLINEHSIGFQTINNQKRDGYNEIVEVKLWEGSSLTAWGANENTPLTDLKMKGYRDVDSLKTEIKKFEKFIRDSDATDETINMCLLKVWQLAQAVELLSSTKVAKEAPEPKKDSNELEMSLISILNNY